MSEVVDWLKAQLDEAERMADRASAAGMHGIESTDEEAWSHLCDLEAVRADIEAKRGLIEAYAEAVAFYEGPGRNVPALEAHYLWMAILHIAKAYRHRLGYQETWPS